MTNDSAPILQWEGKFLRVFKRGRWEYADRVNSSQAVCIVAVNPEGKLLLTEQYRIPVARRVIELPAGLVGDLPGDATESPTDAARRELLEETGYEAGDVTYLISGPLSPGLISEIITFFKATGLRRVSKGGGEGHQLGPRAEVDVDPVSRLQFFDAEARDLLEDPLEAGRRSLPPGVGIEFLPAEQATAAQILRFAEGKESVSHKERNRRYALQH